LKIRSITLNGFKSFADRTKVDFHGGITAIVGPNGCGKSNISDALRAEVSLELSNEDGILPVAYPEVEIGRTVLRGGESTYSLNDQTVRLRDIQDLCRDTGLGANAYSIIEGRMIDAILSDRAEERRSLFEEAAEVGRYKDRRRTAFRRLEQAEHDLRRLDDVIGEVGSKVRSLARQKGRAKRYGELRERRLQLEVAVADERLRVLEQRLAEVDAGLVEARRHRPDLEALLATRDTEHQALRLALVEREQDRTAQASRLDDVRNRLEELERRRLLADERIAAARARIESIRFERGGLRERRESLEAELVEAERMAASASADLQQLQSGEPDLASAVEQFRRRRLDVEHAEGSARETLTLLLAEIGSTGAAGEALRERNRERRRDLDRRLADRELAVESVTALEAELAGQQNAVADSEAKRAVFEDRLGKERVAERESRERSGEFRDRISSLEGELASVTARAGALESMLTSGRDLPAIVSRLLQDPEASDGVHGVLAEFLTVPAASAAAVESWLGPLLHGVVVEDWNSVLRVRDWLATQKDSEGLVLLPLDPGPRAASRTDGGLVDLVEVHGEGAGWARALLEGVFSGEPAFSPSESPWVMPDGSGQDALGVVRLGQPSSGKGVLRRRTELSDLTERKRALAAELGEVRTARESLAGKAAELTDRAAATERELELAATDARRQEALREALAERLGRMHQNLEELDDRISELRERLADDDPSRERDMELMASLEERKTAIELALGAHREELVSATADWERAASDLQQRRLEIARQEARAAAATDRASRIEESRLEIERRDERLQSERTDLESSIERGQEDLGGSEEVLHSLFEERSSLDEGLRKAQELLDERRSDVERRETALRELRQRERDSSERLHELELEATRMRGLRATIRERLEAEWEEEFESLLARTERPEQGEPGDWAYELEQVRQKLVSVGPVNLLAAAEHDEERERFEFLEGQKRDLEAARGDLLDSIQRINEAASVAFQEVFRQVRENFRRIFVTLFEGGEADVWLEDPEDPLDAPIEISASPRGKRTQRIHLLSGGERALTALALLFAIYLAKPSPFCVMDEVDAPLDESNIGRFTAMLEQFKDETQFIVITHNARTIEAADQVYGVTMQEPGVSTLVALDLKDLPRGQVA
jgi:chromosome segregation protein